mmetsp:Transcript_42912/g.112768  ORF Transcript_42912/g.112768 Transcript_42912/m.112768 type:complete len:120 (-) Transcript_42912:254-613(-)
MERAAAHEEKDVYDLGDSDDEVSQSISEIDAFERRMENGGKDSAPANIAAKPPMPRVPPKPAAAMTAPKPKKGNDYIRSAKQAASAKGGDDEDDGVNDAAQSASDIDKFDQRFGYGDDD